jgi:phage gp29-like protein
MTQKPLLIEIARIEKDPLTHDFIGRTLLNPDKVLRTEGASKGIEIYEDLFRDPQIRSTMETRRLAVKGKEWEIIPASDKPPDVKVADFVKEVYESFDLDGARKTLLTGLITGFKPAEIMWDYSEGDIWVKEIKGRSPRRFVFDLDHNLKLLTLSNMIEGEDLPERKFICFRNFSDNGSDYGDPLGSSLYWPVLFKKKGIIFWMTFADKFGSPTAVGKYPPGAGKLEQDALLDAIVAIQQEAALTIPDNMTVELLEAARSSGIDTYQTLCEFMDGQISKVILGHKAAADTTPGKLGNETQAQDIRDDYIKADADGLCLCENESLVKWIVDYNFPDVPRKGYPKVWIRTDPEEDLKPLAERDKILIVDMGLRTGEKYLRDTYGIPEPEPDDQIVTPPAAGFVNGKSQIANGNPNNVSQFTIHDSRFAEELTPKEINAEITDLKDLIAQLSQKLTPIEMAAIMQKIGDQITFFQGDLKSMVTEELRSQLNNLISGTNTQAEVIQELTRFFSDPIFEMSMEAEARAQLYLRNELKNVYTDTYAQTVANAFPDEKLYAYASGPRDARTADDTREVEKLTNPNFGGTPLRWPDEYLNNPIVKVSRRPNDRNTDIIMPRSMLPPDVQGRLK